MKCSVCNNEVRGDMKFCSKCGAPIVKRKFCAQCGEELTSDVKFCRSCGSPNPNYLPPTNQEVAVQPVQPTVLTTPAPVSDPSAKSQGSVPPPPPVSKTEEESPVLEEMSEALEEDSEEFQEKSKKGMVWLWIAVVCVLALGGFIAWYFLYDEKSEKQTPVVETSVKTTDTIAEKVETPRRYDDIETQSLETSHVDEADTKNLNTNQPSVEAANIPDATNLTSEDAYDLFSSLVTDYSIGDPWNYSDIVDHVKQSGVRYYEMSGEGVLAGSQITFNAIKTANKRIYGRYFNDNGTKLDMNGVEDESGNLIIKLGHGRATSFWILKPKVNPHRGGSGTYNYLGSWGHNRMDTNASIIYSAN